jgi:hypothetical protein
MQIIAHACDIYIHTRYSLLMCRYVRLNRNRLKGSDGQDDARTGLAVLYEVLFTMSQVCNTNTLLKSTRCNILVVNGIVSIAA